MNSNLSALFLIPAAVLIGCRTLYNSASEPHVVKYRYVLQGTIAQPLQRIELLSSSSGTAHATFLRNGHKVRKKISADDMEQFDSIVINGDVANWKSNYSPANNLVVLDGYSWSVTIELSNGRIISSGGNNAWPEGDALETLNSLIISSK